MVYEPSVTLEMQLKQFGKKWPIIEVKWCSKIMIIGHYTASIIAYHHTPKMAAVFLDCTIGEPQTPMIY